MPDEPGTSVENGENDPAEVSNDSRNENEIAQDDMAIEEAFMEEHNRSSKYSRHPYHYNLGKTSNVAIVQLELAVSDENYTDQDNDALQRFRKKLELLNEERAVQGCFIYNPSERALLSKRGERSLHCKISKLASICQGVLTSPSKNNKKEMELLLKSCNDLLVGYEDHHEGVGGGGTTIRFEYTIASNNQDPNEIASISFDTENGINPFTTLRVANRNLVCQDIKNLNTKTLQPLINLTKLNDDTILAFSAQAKTMYVFLAEITQQRANSTDPGLFGIHKCIVGYGTTEDYGRVTIPQAWRIPIALEERNSTWLPFGIKPQCLPMIPRFDNQYNIIQGLSPNPLMISDALRIRIDKLHSPYKFVLMQHRLKMITCRYCMNVVPGQEVPGIMETINLSIWLNESIDEKKAAVTFFAIWYLELYHDEFNYLIRRKLKWYKHRPSYLQCLELLELSYKENEWLIKSTNEINYVHNFIALRMNHQGVETIFKFGGTEQNSTIRTMGMS